MSYVIDVLPAADIDQLETLWRELLDHHLADAPHLAALGPARTPTDSWRVRRGQYLQWLATPKATVLAAQGSGHLLGYAMIRAIDAAGSWQWGDQIGVLETLAVGSSARGAHVGRALLHTAHNLLADWDIQVMTISVVAGNEGALRFYRREGASDYLSGASLADLAGLAAEIYARSRPPDPGGGPDGFDDRSVRLETTFEGAGVLGGDLTPDCAAVVGAVLDALSAPAGAGDLRTHGQRYHDALAEAMRRLLGAGLLPGRAGQPVRAWVHLSLAELLALDGDGALLGQWTEAVRARWAGHRAAASAGGSDGAAWLDGAAAAAACCDALVSPVVTGDVDPGALDGLVRLCVELDRLGPGAGPGGADLGGADREPAATAAGPGSMAREALERAIIGTAVELLSGPGGLASFLRRQQLGASLAGPSLPLDIGYSGTVPAAIRHAVTLRDQHCRWAGGCGQPAAACQVHHVRHKANGGPTSVKDCILLCFFHHQVVIHRWGWTLVLNPDGTTTAWNPDRTKVLHSHSPPARAG